MHTSDITLLSFHAVCAALHLPLQAHVLGGRADVTGGASMQEEGEPQGVSALARSAFLCPIAVGNHQLVVLLRRGRARGLSVGLVEARRVTAGLAGVVFMGIRQIACGNTAALQVWRLAVGMAVLLVNVLAQLPPLPLFQHLRLHLRDDRKAGSV